jgi:tRNA nucleotidyltransferase (CCA-adding enzyme)
MNELKWVLVFIEQQILRHFSSVIIIKSLRIILPMSWKNEVLSRIKPTAAEEKALNAQIAMFVKKLNNVLDDTRAVLGGSGAKGTWLKKQHDADIFVVFPASYKNHSAELSDVLEKKLKKLRMPFSRLHGSRDYFRFEQNKFVFEVVPIVKILKANDAANITDVSPLHARWVKKHGKTDEIRLAKAFCKAQKCYGAESYLRGFSGYVLEILVIHYGSFEKLLRASLKWKEKEVIDVARLYKKEDALMAVNKSKLNSPIVVIDPVDKARNAAAALGDEKLRLFQKKAAAFLKRPRVLFFNKEVVTLDLLKKKKNKKKHIVWVEIMAYEGKHDKVGAQLLLAFDYIKRCLTDFDVLKAGWEWQEDVVFWFVVKDNKRDKIREIMGPPVAMKEHVAAFKKKHKKVKIVKGKLVATVAVKNYKLKDVLRTLLKDRYVKDRIKKVERFLVT